MSSGGGGGQSDVQKRLEKRQLQAFREAREERNRLRRLERKEVRSLRSGSLGLRSFVFRGQGSGPRNKGKTEEVEEETKRKKPDPFEKIVLRRQRQFERNRRLGFSQR